MSPVSFHYHCDELPRGSNDPMHVSLVETRIGMLVFHNLTSLKSNPSLNGSLTLHPTCMYNALRLTENCLSISSNIQNQKIFIILHFPLSVDCGPRPTFVSLVPLHLILEADTQGHLVHWILRNDDLDGWNGAPKCIV